MKKNKKKLPIGTQHFEALKRYNEFYLDKTRQILTIINQNRYNFLSRPRRFGKSLTLSVMKNLFLSKKELFTDLYIYDKWNFNPHPVIELSLAGYSKDYDLLTYIKNRGQVYYNDNQIKKFYDFKLLNLGEIIENVSNETKKQVVCLIDEYDKPILTHLNDFAKAEEVRNFFSGFYSLVKDNDCHIRFFFITGLTKLMKMNIFSALNNLEDISFDADTSDLIGYTQQEVEDNFSEELQEIAQKHNKEYHQFLMEVKNEYNGYNFGGQELLYNPWDINSLIKKRKIKSYWADSGIPGAISDYMKESPVDIQRIVDSVREDTLKIKEMHIRVHKLENLRPEVLFFNAGYLTVKEETSDHYKLKFPNNETEQVMMDYFLDLSLCKKYDINNWEKVSDKIVSGIFSKDPQCIQEGVETLIYDVLANIPYDWVNKNPEGWLKSMIGVAIRMNNLYYIGENQNIIGRTDMHIPKEDCVYVLELKANAKASDAVKQIEEKYEQAYRKHFKEIVKIGINWTRKEGQKAVEVIVKWLGMLKK
jgi:hypothetical protein